MKKITFTSFVLALCFLMPDVSMAAKQIDEGHFFHMNHKNGNISMSYRVVNGVRDGIFTIYFETGQVAFECSNVNGMREGIAKGYYESGKLLFAKLLTKKIKKKV